MTVVLFQHGPADPFAAASATPGRLAPTAKTAMQQRIDLVGTSLPHRTTVRSFRKGEVIGISSRDVCALVERGIVSASTHLTDGREFIVELFATGTMIGELGALRRQSLELEYRATSDCDLRFYDGRLLRQMCSTEPDFQETVLASAFARIAELEQRIVASAGSSLISRLAQTLLRLSKIYGADRQQASDEVAISQHDLAATLPASREKVNKGLRRLRAQNVVGGTQGRIVILDRRALEACAKDGSRFS